MHRTPSVLFFSSLVSTALLALGCDDAAGIGGSSGGGAATGGTSTGGQPASGGAGSIPTRPPAERFTLLFRDDFDTLDPARWQLMTHSWGSNLALFSPDTVSVADGELTITLLAAPEGTVDDTGAAKPYLGAEVRSVDAISAGRVAARVKFAKGSAVVSSLVTIYTPWPADNWNELDFECLGKDPTSIQSNIMTYDGPLPAPSTPVAPTMHPLDHPLGFDASADFHEYALEWTPEGAFFLIDGEVVRASNDVTAKLTLPQNVLLTIWASSSPGWVGPVGEDTVGASAVYDWVEVYEYAGE